MAFLKAFWKGYTKHKKLNDEWDLTPKASDMELDTPGSTMEGITFEVKYIGSTPVSVASSAKTTADAVRSIVTKAKSSGRKAVEVQFAVNLRGVSVMEIESKTHLMDISLYRISYCSADAAFGHVFAFIASNDNDSLECHALLCQKRKMGMKLPQTMSENSEEVSLCCCMRSTESEDKKPNVIQQLLAPVPMLIDLTTPIEEKSRQPWTRFED